MKRMDNFYAWDSIGDWKDAMNQDLVRLKSVKVTCMNRAEINRHLDEIIQMGIHNCFPLQIVCFRPDGSYKYFMADPLMEAFWAFIRVGFYVDVRNPGERSIKRYCFNDLSVSDQESLLKAKINSVWIEV